MSERSNIQPETAFYFLISFGRGGRQVTGAREWKFHSMSGPQFSRRTANLREWAEGLLHKPRLIHVNGNNAQLRGTGSVSKRRF
jgi:hypothetical protein